MTDVLLAHSNFLANDAKQRRKMRPFPPLGTLYAASILRQHGFSVALFDATFEDGAERIQRHLLEHRPRLLVVFEDEFNFISKMCLSAMRECACTMAGLAATSGAATVVAGPDASTRPEPYLEGGFDYVLVGEAELSLLELVQRLPRTDGRRPARPSGGQPRQRAVQMSCSDARGLWWRDGHSFRHGPPRSPMTDLDRLPPPAWDLVDVARYRRAWSEAHGQFTLGMVASRGCPYSCVWCAKPIWGTRYASHSPARVAEEMEMLLRRYSPDHLWFADDIFGLERGWLEQLADELAARRVRLPFTIQSRADLMDEATVELLEQCGCREVWIGVESGSQRIVDAMGKSHRVVGVPRTVERLHGRGIRACLFLQFGYPGEKFSDIMATVALVRRSMPDDIGISVTYPMPGTRLFELVSSQLSDRLNWRDSDDLSVLFQGEYESPFYRRIHLLLHRDLACRNRLRKRFAVADIEELRKLEREWSELGRREAAYRTAAATQISLSAAGSACRRCSPVGDDGACGT